MVDKLQIDPGYILDPYVTSQYNYLLGARLTLSLLMSVPPF